MVPKSAAVVVDCAACALAHATEIAIIRTTSGQRRVGFSTSTVFRRSCGPEAAVSTQRWRLGANSACTWNSEQALAVVLANRMVLTVGAYPSQAFTTTTAVAFRRTRLLFISTGHAGTCRRAGQLNALTAGSAAIRGDQTGRKIRPTRVTGLVSPPHFREALWRTRIATSPIAIAGRVFAATDACKIALWNEILIAFTNVDHPTSFVGRSTPFPLLPSLIIAAAMPC